MHAPVCGYRAFQTVECDVSAAVTQLRHSVWREYFDAATFAASKHDDVMEWVAELKAECASASGTHAHTHHHRSRTAYDVDIICAYVYHPEVVVPS